MYVYVRDRCICLSVTDVEALRLKRNENGRLSGNLIGSDWRKTYEPYIGT
jgi:hypothetical protein